MTWELGKKLYQGERKMWCSMSGAIR
jgi:hypothetical protein